MLKIKGSYFIILFNETYFHLNQVSLISCIVTCYNILFIVYYV